MKNITFKEYIANKLEEIGISHVFGVPGSYIMPIWQSLADKFEIILACHETGAGFMAEGFSRGKNNISILLTTAAPGVTNAVTAIANAYMDSIPMLIISGQVSTNLIGHGAFQECSDTDRSFSQHDLLKSITKAQIEINGKDNAQYLFENAINIACNGRPGPVQISIPINIQNEIIEINDIKHYKIFNKITKSSCNLQTKIIEMINESKKPILYVGWGCYLSGAEKQVYELAEYLNSPIVTSMKGIASISPLHEYCLGHIGLGMNNEIINYLEEYKPDLVISLGASMSERTVNPIKHILQSCEILNINIDIDVIQRFKTNNINGDVKNTIISLIPYLNKRSSKHIANDIASLKNRYIQKIASIVTKDLFSMRKAIYELNSYSTCDTVFFPDSGNHWLDCLNVLQLKNSGSMFLSMGLATMGYSFGSAIGYSLANPDKKTVVIAGDGSFLMSGNESVVAVRENLNILIILINNQSLGRVRVWQKDQKIPHYDTSAIKNVNYSLIAKAFGFEAYQITCMLELDNVYKKVFRNKKPIFIELIVDKDEIPICLGGEL